MHAPAHIRAIHKTCNPSVSSSSQYKPLRLRTNPITVRTTPFTSACSGYACFAYLMHFILPMQYLIHHRFDTKISKCSPDKMSFGATRVSPSDPTAQPKNATRGFFAYSLGKMPFAICMRAIVDYYNFYGAGIKDRDV